MNSHSYESTAMSGDDKDKGTQKKDASFSVNVNWTPGETGLPVADDQKPSFWSSIKTLIFSPHASTGKKILDGTAYGVGGVSSLLGGYSAGVGGVGAAATGTAATVAGIAGSGLVVAGGTGVAALHYRSMLKERQEAKIAILTEHLKQTDPELVAAVTKQIQRKFYEPLSGKSVGDMIDRHDDPLLLSNPLQALAGFHPKFIAWSNEPDPVKYQKATVDQLRDEMKKFLLEETGHEFKKPAQTHNVAVNDTAKHK